MAVQELRVVRRARKRHADHFRTRASFSLIARMIVALAVAGLVAVAARRAGLLTPGGAVAGAVVGAAVLFAGWSWAVLLLFFFVSSSALTRWRTAERETLLDPMVEKGGPRDAVQVLANGSVFAVAAVVSTTGGDTYAWQAIGIGALACATADTWSTEIGTVLGGIPRTILGWRQVAPGTSGGITIPGTAAAFAGAIAGAVVAVLLGWPTAFYAVVVGGLSGSLLDSFLGSVFQERRWCPTCDVATERRTHPCGTTTVHRGGIQGFDNDAVNLVSTVAGALITWALS